MMTRLLLLVLVACGTAPILPPVRFANAPPATIVNDRLDVPEVPTERVHMRVLSNFDGQFFRRVTRLFELHREQRALGVNALDEVPNSTWFTNRIGVRSISPSEMAAAPAGVGSPEAHLPWTIVSSKVGGASVGFIIKDARGEKWLMKFDPRGYPEAETATQVIVGKLFWAFGFNVTEDYVVHVRPEDLKLSPEAVVKDVFGGKHPLDQAGVDERLARVERAQDGSLRALVSHWIPGKPLGGHAAEGVRKDDPNDRIPHELRRDLRGAYVLYSWVDHVDIHGANFLDMWTTDPADPARHYVKHYLIDFGIALGFAARKNQEPRFGYEYYVDFAQMTRAFLSLGLASRPWEDRKDEGRRGLGLFETETYDPGSWKALTPWYVPIYDADRYDKFWAAKILIRFTREQIKAAVDAGKLSDPAVARWLTDALVDRQRATVRYWFARVNPLDEMVVDAKRLCFKDLAIAHAFTPASGTRYTIASYDAQGRAVATLDSEATGSGVTCVPLELARGRDNYTVVRITTRRLEFAGSTDVHIAVAPDTGMRRVIGIWRP